MHLVSETTWAASGTRSPQTSQTLPSMALVPAMQFAHTGSRATLVRASPQMRQSDGKTSLKTLAKAEETVLRREKTGGSCVLTVFAAKLPEWVFPAHHRHFLPWPGRRLPLSPLVTSMLD